MIRSSIDLPWAPAPSALAMSPDVVHVWRIALEQSALAAGRLEGTLSPDEGARADRLRAPRGREHFIAARGAMRAILGRYLEIEPGAVRFRYGPQGKPSLAEGAGLEFNLAHSGGLALLAVARGRALGIDIEEVRPMPDAGRIVDRFFSERECSAFRALPEGERLAAFFRCWTRKEAYMKATGEGMSLPLDRFDVSLDPGAPPRLLGVVGRPGEVERWVFHDLDPGPNHAGALAVEGAVAAVRCFRWAPE